MTEDAVPINRASDDELFHALESGVLAPLKEEYAKAISATAGVMAQGLDAETMKARIGPLWRDVWHKLDSADYVLGHLRTRITRLRTMGILSGDPREAEVLKVDGP